MCGYRIKWFRNGIVTYTKKKKMCKLIFETDLRRKDTNRNISDSILL